MSPDRVAAWRSLLEFHAATLDALADAFRARHRLSVSEFDVLVSMTPGRSLRHKELADRVILSRSALTRLIDRLVARGLLERTPDDTDGRGVRLSLTTAGEKLRRQAVVTNASVVNGRLAALTAQDLHDLDRITTTLNHHERTTP